MARRPEIPTNVKRTLWAEAGGHCMNPSCFRHLITPDHTRSIGKIAHIVPHSQGGDLSPENLILLCSNCADETEPLYRPEIAGELRQWKRDAKLRLAQTYTVNAANFQDLEQRVTPLLAENYEIFNTYGPHTNSADAHTQWQAFEPKLLSNNRRLKLILNANLSLLHMENRRTVRSFLLHADEFANTRQGPTVRQALFPTGLLSIFGIEEDARNLPPSANALQNLIAKLVQEERFISLSLYPDAVLTYRSGSEDVFLHLDDRPRAQQIYFSEHCYTPNNTDLNQHNLVFVAKVLYEAGIPWRFANPADLTVLAIGPQVHLKLIYAYCISIDEINQTNLQNITHLANMHHWNGGPISAEASNHLSSSDVSFVSATDLPGFLRGLR